MPWECAAGAPVSATGGCVSRSPDMSAGQPEISGQSGRCRGAALTRRVSATGRRAAARPRRVGHGLSPTSKGHSMLRFLVYLQNFLAKPLRRRRPRRDRRRVRPDRRADRGGDRRSDRGRHQASAASSATSSRTSELDRTGPRSSRGGRVPAAAGGQAEMPGASCRVRSALIRLQNLLARPLRRDDRGATACRPRYGQRAGLLAR